MLLISYFPGPSQDIHRQARPRPDLTKLLGKWTRERGLLCITPPSVFTVLNTAPGGQRSLGDRAGWRGMGRMRPQPQVGEDFLDDLALVNEGDDAHGAPTPLTHQRISLIDLLDQLGPALLEDR